MLGCVRQDSCRLVQCWSGQVCRSFRLRFSTPKLVSRKYDVYAGQHEGALRTLGTYEQRLDHLRCLSKAKTMYSYSSDGGIHRAQPALSASPRAPAQLEPWSSEAARLTGGVSHSSTAPFEYAANSSLIPEDLPATKQGHLNSNFCSFPWLQSASSPEPGLANGTAAGPAQTSEAAPLLISRPGVVSRYPMARMRGRECSNLPKANDGRVSLQSNR
jgi:hypothetical protein